MPTIPSWFLSVFNSSSAETNDHAPADAAVAITADHDSLTVGQTVTLTITASDDGPGPATGVDLSVPFSSDFQISTATPSDGSYDTSNGTWTLGTLAPGSAATLTISAVVVNPGADAITAQISSQTSADLNVSNNSAAVAINIAAPTTPTTQANGTVIVQNSDQVSGQPDLPQITPIPASVTVAGGAGYTPDTPYVPTTSANQQVLTVGVGEEFSTIAAAVAASKDGDVIEVNAGTYVNDFTDVQTNVTIVGVGGMVNMVATEDTPNEKGIMLVDDSVEIDNFIFSGGTVDSADGGNGAGIRYEGGNLVLNNDAFIDNQDGMLAFPVLGLPSNTITINRSTFDQNGATSGPSSGYTHNIYVGAVTQFTVNNSVFEEANVGHELKSRALAATLTNNIFYDGPNGTASYDIDLPNGGNDLLTGNVIEKGPNAENNAMVHFGGEGIPSAGSSLTFQDNTFLNDDSGSTLGLLNQTTLQTQITNNAFVNMTANEIGSGLFIQSNNYDGSGQLLAPSASTAFSAGTNTDVFSNDTLDHTVALDTSTGVVGGGGLLTVFSDWGHVTVLGGTGGLDFYEDPAVGGSYVTTAPGSTNTLDLLGIAGDTVQSEGTDTLVLGPGNGSFLLEGNSTVTSGIGANQFSVTGTSSILAGGNDVISISNGATVTLTGAEDYVRTESGGGTFLMDITQGGTSEQATVVGGSLSIVVANEWMEMQTSSGGQGADIRLGAGDAGIQAYGADTIQAGSGRTTVVARANAQIYAGSGTLDVYGQSASGTSVYGASGDSLIDGAGGGITYWGGAGANTVQANLGNVTVDGGAGLITVLNSTGDQITGGSGGMNVTDNGGSTISAAFGASDTINAGVNGITVVVSLGNDLINMGRGNSSLAAFGNSTVTGSTGNASYDFEGDDVFTAQGFSRVTVGGAATLTAVSSGIMTDISSNGGKIFFSETANSDGESLTVTGGAGTYISSDATAVSTAVYTGDNGKTQVTLGRGAESVFSYGVDTITGGVGADTIALNHAGASVTGGSGAMQVGNYDETAGDSYTVTAGTGSMTYWQAYASTLFNAGSGASSVNGGIGAVTVVGSTGNLTLVGGDAGTSYIGGNGNAVISTAESGGTIEFGSGSTTVNELGFGSGVTFEFMQGHGGGIDVINTFRQGVDSLDFENVNVTSQTQSGGSTYVTLSDHTRVVFMGQTVTL